LAKITIKGFLEKQGFHKIPLSVNKAGHFELKVMLNDKPARFILDTGASHTVVDGTLADKYELVVDDKKGRKAGGLGTSGLITKVSKGNRLGIGKVQITNHKLILLDLSHVNHSLKNNGSNAVIGIAGADILKKRNAVIDYKSKSLFLK
jgi:predicted aspartyl protease